MLFLFLKQQGHIVALDDLDYFCAVEMLAFLCEKFVDFFVCGGFRDVSDHDSEIRGSHIVNVNFIVEIFHLTT